MADDKTTKTPEQPVTDSGPGKETPPAPPKEPEKVSVSPEPEKKTEPEVKNPQVSVYNFAEIMKEKKVEERAAAPSGEKPAPAKTENRKSSRRLRRKRRKNPKSRNSRSAGAVPRKQIRTRPQPRSPKLPHRNRKMRSKRNRRKKRRQRYRPLPLRRNPKNRRMHHAGARNRSSISS